MFAKLNHLAIVSENFALSSRFYEALFGMKRPTAIAPKARRWSATAMSA